MNCQCGSAGFWAAILAVALLAIILAQPSLHTWHDNYYAELARINNSTNTDSHTASISPSASSSPSSSVTPPPPLRPAPLHRFLIATNVDHALAAAQQFPGEYRKEEYVKSIQYLIDHEWTTNPQGIYNLLQHSYMIPNDAKFATLLRGLQESSDIQYRLAAAVGIQFTPSAYLDHAVESDATFRRLMLDYALDHSSDDFLAARAFLGIKERLRHARDTRFVLTLLSSPINWRNALTWLIKKVETKSDPLTTERLRQLLESAKADDAKGEPVSSEPHTLPWSEPWATRLRDLDIDSVIGTIGPVLDDHIKQMSQGGSTISRLSQWQEIEIPDYAPLMVGQIDTNGRVQFTGEQIESSEVADTKKSTNVQDDADKPPTVPTFQPDEVLTQSTQVIEEL